MQDTSLAVGYVTSWVGRTRVTASERGVRSVWLPNWRAGEPVAEPAEVPGTLGEPLASEAAAAHLRTALGELAEYFAGTRRVFTVPLDLDGPAFYQRVWAAVAAVPFGETRGYGEIARQVEAPAASRAVGAANGANPVAPFVPCHRIVGGNGMLVGYGPGVALKRRLLVMEDGLPTSDADYPAWVRRTSARLGTGHVLLGVRARGTYCRPECAHAQRAWERPARVFRTVDDAQAAGFRACGDCQPDAIAHYAAVPLLTL